MALCPSKRGALSAGLPGRGWTHPSFLSERCVLQEPCLVSDRLVPKCSDSSKSRTADSAWSVLALGTHRGRKCDILSLRRGARGPSRNKGITSAWLAGCWAHAAEKRPHGQLSPGASVVFVLQKEKATPQTKKIASVTSIPGCLFCVPRERQEALSRKEKVGGDYRMEPHTSSPKQGFPTLAA